MIIFELFCRILALTQSPVLKSKGGETQVAYSIVREFPFSLLLRFLSVDSHTDATPLCLPSKSVIG
jgi:hypothetical protein